MVAKQHSVSGYIPCKIPPRIHLSHETSMEVGKTDLRPKIVLIGIKEFFNRTNLSWTIHWIRKGCFADRIYQLKVKNIPTAILD